MASQVTSVASDVAISTVNPADQSRAIDVIVLAFSTDPTVRWLYPDPHEFLANFPEFTRAFGGRALEHGTAYQVGDFTGVAMWLPPGSTPDEEALGELLERTLSGKKLETVFAILEQMGSFHPDEPTWYLPLIGVDPIHQRNGYGAALMRHALARCDQDGIPAYLESSNPANISLYKRHGFEAIGSIQIGEAPPIVPMLRRPRPRS